MIEAGGVPVGPHRAGPDRTVPICDSTPFESSPVTPWLIGGSSHSQQQGGRGHSQELTNVSGRCTSQPMRIERGRGRPPSASLALRSRARSGAVSRTVKGARLSPCLAVRITRFEQMMMLSVRAVLWLAGLLAGVPRSAGGCGWTAQLCEFGNLTSFSSSIERQGTVSAVKEVMAMLTDQAVDPLDPSANYLGFPYYLRIDLACETQEMSLLAVREAYLTGLQPVVTVIFQEPVHPVRQKPQRLEAWLSTAPVLDDVRCGSELCSLGWYAPMPLLNGSVVYRVLVSSNGQGHPIPDRSTQLSSFVAALHSVSKRALALYLTAAWCVCFPGLAYRSSYSLTPHARLLQAEKKASTTQCTKELLPSRQKIPEVKPEWKPVSPVPVEVLFPTLKGLTGCSTQLILEKVAALESMLSLSDPSRPLWFVEGVSPVLILGRVPGFKAVLLTASEFTHTTLIELSMESCWVGSLGCPQAEFSSTIQDAIATESTLFIRQNQLVHQFTGNFSLLPLNTPPSVYWKRVLQWLCVSKLVPVTYPHHGREYFYILGGGWQRGHIYRAQIQDGDVEFTQLLDSVGRTPCQFLQRESHSLCPDVSGPVGAAYESFHLGAALPKFLPRENGLQQFVMVTGSTQYSDIPLLLRGINFNPFSRVLFLWGNALLCSFDMGFSYVFLTGFPSDQRIKYFTLSLTGEFTFVTDSEQVWWGQERMPTVVSVRPSAAWDAFSSLQSLKGWGSYERAHSLVTVFYDSEKLLQELVYTVDSAGRCSLVKRRLPVPEILSHYHFSQSPYSSRHTEQSSEFMFERLCPFFLMRVEEVPPPELFSRVQHYRAEPPTVLRSPGLHSISSLAVYQGLLHQLLWLHASYNRPYGDPVHDPTWRWWKNKVVYEDYYFYLASNRLSSGGVYVSMQDYAKVYSSPGTKPLPDRIYLDRGTSYSFSVYLTASLSQTDASFVQETLGQMWLSAGVSDASFILVNIHRQEIIGRGAVLYRVQVSDQGKFPGQALTGQDLMVFTLFLSVVHSELHCYQQTESGLSFQGQEKVPVYIGCPPGRRLVFDVSSTLRHGTKLNKRYFNCPKPDPERPCFYYEDTFYPFFLIQDMVSGESGRFLGSYTFKVVGGGPYSYDNLRDYTVEEVLRYNSLNHSSEMALVWMMADESGRPFNTTEEGFPILQGASSSIGWICQRNSPCADIPVTGLMAPEFFFLIEVSNRGVDISTYCDYALQFVIHVHGLPLDPYRGLFHMLVSADTHTRTDQKESQRRGY
ncbi:CTSRG protein, partial [Atractosteus spatula]|nr:CTSRG protein [Atractosteus spatula]